MRSMTLVLLLLIAIVHPASAQECAIAAYADAEGQSPPWFMPTPGTLFPVYVVLFAEDTVAE